MLEESKNLITRNFLTLMKECDVDVLKKPMVERSVFTKKEMDNIFLTNDQRHNKRVFFFNIQKKEQRAFIALIECLRQTNQDYIARLLQPALGSDKVFKQMFVDDETDDEAMQNLIQLPVNAQPHNLIIKVQPSESFYESLEQNRHLEYYSTRSKKRGRFLVINNYKFINQQAYRNGADIDNLNLITLFKQMGGWDIVKEENKTAAEMKLIIQKFASDNINTEYDICLVIILSHGNLNAQYDTLIYGTDENYILTSFVIQQFANEHCKSWRDKPKVLMFQVCRGEQLDFSVRDVTETDSAIKKEPPESEEVIDVTPLTPGEIIRSQDDIVVCYSTLSGFKSHRNASRGSWYIEVLCEKLMNFAHNTSFDDILMLVDQGLKRRRSEWWSMQTTEHSYRGFNKKLYLHPGIYFEDDTVKKFFT